MPYRYKFKSYVVAVVTGWVVTIGPAALPIQAEPLAQQHLMPLGLPPSDGFVSSQAEVSLGQALFQATALSRDGTVSCASCHQANLGFSGSTPRAVGVGGFKSSRHAPPLFNLYVFRSFMADGRARDLYHQFTMPLESKEMDVNWPTSCAQLNMNPQIADLAGKAKVAPLDRSGILHALASYVGSLVSGNSRFDRFYYGGDEQALTPQEQNGMRIFVRKAHCSSCHLLDGTAAPMTDAAFHTIGVGFNSGIYQDRGRYMVTGDHRDDGAFKTPTLRNVALRPYFMHDGSMESLEEVIRFYNKGGNRGATNVDPRIKPLYLGAREVQDLIAFLKSLTSKISSLEMK